MSHASGPKIIRAELWSALPDALRITDEDAEWVSANKAGARMDSFLEGPTFAADGTLHLVDIPYGRILTVSPEGTWDLLCRYDGWPNGMRWRDGGLTIADYRRGILRLEQGAAAPVRLLSRHRSESFKGCNDLWFAGDGTLFFTDQGQTGLHDPTGRVYRLDPGADHPEALILNGPSPNGLVTDLEDRVLFVAMTRSCEIWRLPLFQRGTSKVGLFARLPGGVSGPDGMALDREGNLYVCHAGRGRVFVFDPIGDEIARIDCRHIGRTTTNLAFGGPEGDELFITVSDKGAVARAKALAPGRA